MAAGGMALAAVNARPERPAARHDAAIGQAVPEYLSGANHN